MSLVHEVTTQTSEPAVTWVSEGSSGQLDCGIQALMSTESKIIYHGFLHFE